MASRPTAVAAASSASRLGRRDGRGRLAVVVQGVEDRLADGRDRARRRQPLEVDDVAVGGVVRERCSPEGAAAARRRTRRIEAGMPSKGLPAVDEETTFLQVLEREPAGGKSFLGWEQPVADGGWVCWLGASPLGFAPRVMSARRAKLAQITLSGVDLRACRFADAHGLDGLRLERARFAEPPSGWRLRWRRPRWTRRQTIAEEHHWRAKHGHGSGWYEGEVTAPDWLEQASEPLEHEQIAGIYRELRKGREDNKDEPGAADFYYGEMEMRRQRDGQPRQEDKTRAARAIPRAERWVVWSYWLVAGYGLRASRALVALALTTALLGAVSLDLWGFRPDRSYGRALLFALESSISLLRAPEAKLTAGGEVIQIALRLAGPLFFGLALVSLRGRVKR
jgi:hypothetical protein